ncbi:glutathione ABC transporter substrate-binding protein [Neobacillus notoginsengisoli]|uniref:Glutathione ABC transporter substrate-binding protein n=1 Tax=Neobacillus notoginsengisoli TaxID=1578198 RepID=A0A417YY49_9BACI|nr:glutathione ABC transporter substrate-binding protein [Neobacillus notoginsengisoli]RHW42698.1 glutathione ABC transporter substrate-binding protein [Neobacillus notoginsengisoli]
MKAKKNIWLTLMLAFVLILTACGGNNASNKGDGSGGDKGAAKEGGELVFVVPSDAPTLDPHGVNDTATTNATTQIFDRLTDYDKDGKVIPSLAESFEQVDDLTWEFKLKEGVTFHDGSELKADAVKMNIDRLLDPEFASPRAVVLNMIKEVVVVDDHTVHFKTEEPFAPLPAHLAHNAASIIAPSAIEEEKNGGKTVDENPIGTGPFKFDTWNRGAEIKFVKNDDYWGEEKAKLDSVVFKVVPEQATRVSMLETGEAHVMLVGSSDVKQLEGIEGIELDRVKGTRMDYVGFNMNKKPFDNLKVRQAIAMAINKQDIVDGILDGQGVAAVGPLAPTVVGNSQDVKPLEFDVKKAKSLLAEAGFPDGFKTTLFVNEGSKERADIAELVQAQLAEIGIKASIEVIEWGAFIEKTGAGEHEMFVLGWTTVTGDADYGLYALFHSSMHGAAGNRSFYTNPKVDELLDKGRTATNQDERNAVYKEVSQILIDEAPMVYLQHPDFVHGLNGIDGLFVDFSGIPFFHKVSLTK